MKPSTRQDEHAQSSDERRTTQLCHDEHEGARCTRQRGHDGQHECLYSRGQHTLRWG